MDPTIVVACITGMFGIVITWQNTRTNRSIKTNHGKTIGQHVELASERAAAAKFASELVALQLDEYKKQQAVMHETLSKQLMDHTNEDRAFQEEVRPHLIPLKGKPS